MVEVTEDSKEIIDQYSIDNELCENCCSQIMSCESRKYDEVFIVQEYVEEKPIESFANNGILLCLLYTSPSPRD